MAKLSGTGKIYIKIILKIYLMKIKLLKGFLPLAAAAFLLGSCSDDKFGSDSSSGKQISFRLQGNLPSSRATGTTVENINAFVVNAQTDWSEDPVLFSSQTVARLEGQANAFDYSPKRYYPDEAKTAEFSAYSPVTGKVGGFMGGTDNTITYTVPKPAANGDTAQEDLLVAYTPVKGEIQPSGGKPVHRGGFESPVPLVFKHALSRVFVKASNKNKEPVVIKELSLNNLYNEGMLKIDGDINKEAAGYKVLWERTGRESEKPTRYPYVLLEAGVSVPAETSAVVYVVGKDQGMLVLPQTTVNSNNGAVPTTATDFYVEVTYHLSNIQRTVRAAFTDINGLQDAKDNGKGLTFEMGRQYALTLGFDDTDIKFDITVESWEPEEPELAYAVATVVFNDNIPVDAAGNAFTQCTIANNTYSKFINEQSIEETTGGLTGDVLGQAAPKLAGYTFLGYYDAREGGTQYFAADEDGKLKLASANVPFFDGTTWNKVGPSCTLYAHWKECFWSGSNIYFKPDDEPVDGSVGSLTFALSGEGKEGYQGLYFKWGSLIGVAAYPNGSYDTNTYLYIPAVGTGVSEGKYYKVKSDNVAAIAAGGGSSDLDKAVRDYADKRTNGEWGNIHSATDTDLGGSVDRTRDKSPLTDASNQTLYEEYKGDICKFLSDKKVTNGSRLTKTWVMPKNEVWKGRQYGQSYNQLIDDVYEYTWTDNGTTNGTADGDRGTLSYMTYTFKDGEVVVFPAAAYRNDGLLDGVGTGGAYWCSSASDAVSAYGLLFVSGSVYPGNSLSPRTYGFSVRCVRE
jgi:hypothetical protein